MSQFNSYMLHMDVFKMGVAQKCSHSGGTYRICHIVAETISVICSKHSYQSLCMFVI